MLHILEETNFIYLTYTISEARCTFFFTVYIEEFSLLLLVEDM